jgi:hypothetical protein
MPELQSYKIGDKVTLKDIANAPEGSWIVRETMQFLRTQTGHPIASLTPIEGGSMPANRTPERFTLVYAGNAHLEKSAAVSDALNCL